MSYSFEISRFTYFYQDMYKEDICPNKFDNDSHEEIKFCETDFDKYIRKYEVPLSSHFSDIFRKENENLTKVCKDKYERVNFTTKVKDERDDDLEHIINMYGFDCIDNNVIVFERRVRTNLGNKFKAIELINEDLTSVYRGMISDYMSKKKTSWQGDYVADGDFFFFINLSLDRNFYDNSLEENNRYIIDDIKRELFDVRTGQCIFELLNFTDKTFPSSHAYSYPLNQVLSEELQPLIVVSTTNQSNKLIIFDERLFVRCFPRNKDKVDLNESYPIRLVLLTILLQRAYLEFSYGVLKNIMDPKSASGKYTFADLQNLFTRFTDSFWRIDVSSSLYLNRSYRLVGKLWRLNVKFMLVKNHLERNIDLEHRSFQDKVNKILIFLGIISLANIVIGFDALIIQLFRLEPGRYALILGITSVVFFLLICIYCVYGLLNEKK